ncbi:hypothetical protein MRB53_015833 [Persea americana]|uniref:Uncharacterized protein n=1 Tax=Persea americana TaxID=3435 RepID=A0ACC2M0M4_PERAE|nr:hypothetical protein MRB53_015833 [Persea americana]
MEVRGKKKGKPKRDEAKKTHYIFDLITILTSASEETQSDLSNETFVFEILQDPPGKSRKFSKKGKPDINRVIPESWPFHGLGKRFNLSFHLLERPLTAKQLGISWSYVIAFTSSA